MSVVVALACPVCGGPVSNSSEQCEFCGSYVFIKSDLPKLSPANLNRKVIQDQIKELRARFRSNSFDEEAKYGLGVAYYSLGLLSDATRELTEASVLMPENPHIHSQLAVVLRDRFREGERSALPGMRERISTALKLDSDHVESLSLLYSLQLADGDTKSAAKTFDKLQLIAPEQARNARIDVLKRRLKTRFGDNNWSAIRSEVHELGRLDNESARTMLQEHIRSMPIAFPLAFTGVGRARLYSTVAPWSYGIGGLIALFLFTNAQLPFVINFLAGSAAIFLAYVVPKYIRQQTLRKTNVYQLEVVSGSPPLVVLISLMDDLERVKRGYFASINIDALDG